MRASVGPSLYGRGRLTGRGRREGEQRLTRAPYRTADALIKDINFDKEVAAASAARPAYKVFADDEFLSRPSTLAPPESDPAAPRVAPNVA